MKHKDLKEVVGQLRKAVEAHGKQADIIEKHIDSMEDSPMKKYKSDAQRKAIYASKAESAMKKRGLWDNIHAKRKRIAAGSGEKMRKKGDKRAPSAKDLKESQTKK